MVDRYTNSHLGLLPLSARYITGLLKKVDVVAQQAADDNTIVRLSARGPGVRERVAVV
jgi:hypothetical protein